MRLLTSELIDNFAEDGSADLVKALSGPLPMMVVGDLIGVAPENREQFREWSDTIVHQDVDQPQTVDAGRAAAAAVVEHFAELLRERRSWPKDDLASALLEATVDGEHLIDEEILGFCFLLVVAGTETTTNLIGTGALALAGSRTSAPSCSGSQTCFRVRSRRCCAGVRRSRGRRAPQPSRLSTMDRRCPPATRFSSFGAQPTTTIVSSQTPNASESVARSSVTWHSATECTFALARPSLGSRPAWSSLSCSPASPTGT